VQETDYHVIIYGYPILRLKADTERVKREFIEISASLPFSVLEEIGAIVDKALLKKVQEKLITEFKKDQERLKKEWEERYENHDKNA